MAHGDAREGKLRGKIRMEWVASSLALYVGTWSIHGLSADPHSSTASSRLDWTEPPTPTPADLNGLVRFAERPNLVSARVPSRFESALTVKAVQSSWNVTAHGDAREGKWKGNWWMEWVASTLHTTSEHGVSSITTADAHNSADISRMNWRPWRFEGTRPFRRKTKSGFCACAITFQTQSTSQHEKVNSDVTLLLLVHNHHHNYTKNCVLMISRGKNALFKYNINIYVCWSVTGREINKWLFKFI